MCVDLITWSPSGAAPPLPVLGDIYPPVISGRVKQTVGLVRVGVGHVGVCLVFEIPQASNNAR